MTGTTPVSRGRRAPISVLVSAAWIGPAVLAGFQAYIQDRLDGTPPDWRSIVWEGGDWLLYAFLTPLVFWFARHFPLSRSTGLGRLGVHLGAAIGLCAVWATGGILLRRILFVGHALPYPLTWLPWFLTSLPFGVAVYAAVLAAEHALFYFVASRERDAEAARLSARLAEARLAALRMQMQPHFLLNSLNAVAVVIRDHDSVTAGRILDHLGELLRRVVRTDRPPEIPLVEELDFVRQLLAIEEIRFADRLRPVFDIDSAVLQAAVPEFVLQPLVENALRHGLAKRVEATLLRIAAQRDGGQLVLRVTDDGPGPGAALQEGVGLSNLRERLATAYGAAGVLRLNPSPSGGMAAEVRVPYRELPLSVGTADA
jgi:two-component system, LytTR family, sensor kinase